LEEKRRPTLTIYHTISIPQSEAYKDAKIGGNTDLQGKLSKTLEGHKHVFSYTLPAKPAKVKPLQFEVDREQWETRSNQLPPLPQSYLKDKAIQAQVQEMLQASIISQGREEQAWSQVHLVAKPDCRQQ